MSRSQGCIGFSEDDGKYSSKAQISGGEAAFANALGQRVPPEQKKSEKNLAMPA
jgi:hypothetical protein